MEYQLTNQSFTIKALLRKINWDFNHKSVLNANEIKPFDSRKFHWFPATYIPEIPFSLIEILSKEHAVIYDPFAGSGTTYFQAIMLNRHAITSDSNIISIQYIKSLAYLIRENAKLDSIEDEISKILDSFDKNTDYITENFLGQSLLLTPWFHPSTLQQIAYLYGCYTDCTSYLLKTMLYVLLAGSIKNMCSQQRGYGYIADNVKPRDEEIQKTNRDLLGFVSKKLSALINEININKTMISPDDYYQRIRIDEDIVQHDCSMKSFLPPNSVDVVITSPPYPNMIDYSKSQRLLYYLFGIDFQKDLNSEIGARAFRSRKNSVEIYVNQMKLVFENLTSVLKTDGLFCLVLPYYDQKNISRQKAIHEILNFFDTSAYSKEAEYIRNINQSRKVQNASLSTLDQELITIYRKIS